METWSSWPWDEGMESHDAGQHRPLFWDTMDAAVYCGIMKPLLRPGSATRYLGRPLRPSMSWKVRRSEMLASSLMAMASESMGMAMGSPWKFPADITMSSSGKILGLSVAELISFSRTDFTYRMLSLTAPCTCGMQRKL